MAGSRRRERQFRDRAEAGQALAELVAVELGAGCSIVLALPRGGVPVAAAVARRLAVPLDIVLVRKLRTPGRPELAMGAVALVAGVSEVVRNADVILRYRVTEAAFDAAIEAESANFGRLQRSFRPDRPPLLLTGEKVLIVDDGLATGATMTAAVRAARGAGARRVYVGVPVGSAEACQALKAEADAVVCVSIPIVFGAVGLSYDDFSPVSEQTVHDLLCGGGVGS